MNKLFVAAALLSPLSFFAPSVANAFDGPIRALLVTGGCCHDYPLQRELIEEGLEGRLNIQVDHLFLDPPEDWPHGAKTRTPIPLQANPAYGVGYDVIIHNECTAGIQDPQVRQNVLAPHLAGVPGVVLHCGFHSYRPASFREPAVEGTADATWFEFTGIQSTGHGDVSPIEMSLPEDAPPHPITAGIELWETGDEELYNNVTTFDG